MHWRCNRELARVASRKTLPEGLETGLCEVASFSPEVPNFPNGCHVCEVEIDPETGTTRVQSYVVPLGIAHIDMPATPEKVWRAIRAAQGD